MRWTSTFSTDSLEREYQAELLPEKIRLTRIMTGLGMMLTLGYMVLDLWAISADLLTIWSLRGMFITTLAITFLSTATSRFPAVYPYVISAAALVMGAGVCGMIWVADPGDAAVDTYQAGLVLIIMAIYTLTYAPLWLSTMLAVALTAGYVAVVVLVHGYDAPPKNALLIGNLFLFVSITVIGITAQILRDSYSRENYLLRHSLQRDVEIKEEEKRRAAYLAEHDPLTGVGNRLRFDRDANALLDRARVEGGLVHVLFLDLDGFKPVNDRHGHAAGDRVLKVLAERIRQCLRRHDVLARIGGDEFVIALPHGADEPEAGVAAARRIAAAIGEPVELRGARLRISASIGVAVYPADGDDLDAVIRAADAQMYVAKKLGKPGIAATPGCQATPLVV